MKKILAIILHPFAATVISLIIGSLFVLNNEKYADDTIPTLFYGDWSIYLGFAIYIIGGLYLAYAIIKTILKKKKQ